MKRFTLILSLLVAMVTTAMAQGVLIDRTSLLANFTETQCEWTSEELTAPEGEFKKLRITFMENNNNALLNYHPFVTIAEFYLYDKDGNVVELAESNFSSNATQSTEGSLAAICDGITTGAGTAYDWYWHSMYNGTPNPNGYHYLEIDLTDIDADLSTYKIGWVTRNKNAVPAEIYITTGATTKEVRTLANAHTMMPALTTNESAPILYKIKNVRNGNVYANYAGNSNTMTLSSELSTSSYFYFTGSITDGVATVKIHNLAADGKLCAAYNSWTNDGIDWYIQGQETGLSISNKLDCNGDSNTGTSWNNARNESRLVEYWSGDDIGSSWEFERVHVVNPSLETLVIEEIGSAATEIDENTWYVLNNVGKNNYVSQEETSWKMRDASNLPKGSVAAEKAGYLFRIIKAADGEHYNIISGNGMTFMLGYNTANTALKPIDFEIGLIGESSDIFYMYDTKHGYTADGQGSGYNFVGWSSTPPTSAGGNDSYRFLPVKLVQGNMNQYELEALIAEIEAMNIVAGTNIADYTEATVNALNNAIAAAKAVETATEDDVETLQAALDGLRIVLPDPDKFYYFDCVYKLGTEEIRRKLHINANNQLNWVATQAAFDAAGSRAIFQFEEGTTPNTVKIKSVHTQSYMGAISGTITFGETGADITIARTNSNEVDGTLKPTTVMFTTDGTAGIHANANPVTAYNNIAISNHYELKEVTDFKHTLNVTEAGWSTLVLGFNATIPTAEGFKAYTVASVEDGYVKLAEATGVLGANTPIIVNAPATNYDFAYTTEVATITESGLEGTLYNKNIQPDGVAYVLSNKNGIGLYKAVLNQAEGTAFLNNANKAYLVVPATEGTANVASYSFRFGEGTTGVENVVVENEVKAIYDLTGRRVENISASGIYIVGGRKVLVK